MAQRLVQAGVAMVPLGSGWRRCASVSVSVSPNWMGRRMCSTQGTRDNTTKGYNFQEVEPRWHHLVLSHLERANEYFIEQAAPKWYQLVMFPYPSGKLHMGHVRVYTISDCFARYYSMKGRRVLHPMGWDAFGLPAENAAILNRVDPAEWTKSNIEFMQGQLQSLGLSFNYDTFATCEERYYKQTQRLFLELYKKGLAYQGMASVHWDPVDQTVLANEQVDAEGRSWRSGALVEKRDLKQWFLRITDFSEELLSGLDKVDWPSDVVAAQKQWIGKSTGHFVEFPLTRAEGVTPQSILKIFTTRIDTLKYVDFLAISADHPLAKECSVSLGNHEVGRQIPFFAAVGSKRIPVYVAQYVLSEYGTGAVMGVSRHDERDATFLDQMKIEQLPEEELHQLKVTPTTTFRLRDWLVSRQRYWGCPIPIIHCPKCGPMPVPEKDLPVRLPTTINNGPLGQDQEWSQIVCPCEERLPAKRESDTLDTFVDSSFYFHRYLDTRNEAEICSPEKRDRDLPVDLYVGGKEHACMHLLYARFIHKVLMNNTDAEPFSRLLTQGMVLGKTRKTSVSRRYLLPGEETQEGVIEVFEKMSKSKFNGISPSELIHEHGADVLRLYTLFKAPPHLDLEWDEKDIIGMKRWIGRLWSLVNDAGTQESRPLNVDEQSAVINSTILHVESVVEKTHSLNTAIAALMKASTQLAKDFAEGRNIRNDVRVLLRLLVPFAPFFAHEAATVLGIPLTELMMWPEVGPAREGHSKSVLAVQINGKTRGSLEFVVGVDDPEALAVRQFVDHYASRTGTSVKRVIKPENGRIINFVMV